MLFAAMLLIQAGVTAPAFTPPLATPLLITTEHRSSMDGAERRYALRRLVRFQRSDAGYRAEVRVLAPSTEAAGAVGGMIEAGFATLAGRTLVFHLDAKGQVRQIEDMDALWERLCEGIGNIVAAKPSLEAAARTALTQRISGPLRALPDERRLAMLSTLVTAIIAEEPPAPAGTVAAVRLPGASPLGQKLVLDGMRTTTAAAAGEIETVIRASSGTPGEGGRVELERTRRSDPRTGLLTFSSDQTRTTLGAVQGGRESVRNTIVRLVPAGANSWTTP
jgi:hypothetical protein